LRKIFIGSIIGAILALLVSFGLYRLFKKSDDRTQNDYYVISNQIKKMNKMVVMEQDFSTMQKTKMTSQLLGSKYLPSTSKEIITFTKTNAQVTYDLNAMKIEVDSIGKRLIIRSLPEPQIRIIPSVEIQSMDDSFINRIEEKDIKKVTQAAKDHAYQNVNQKMLIEEGRKQLRANLDQIFVLAKALHYSIEDKTGIIDISKL